MFDQRDEIQEKRLQHQLEMQSMQIEHVFNRHQVEAHVAGGMIKPRSISFNLQTQLATGLERLKILTDDLMHTLGVPVSLSREEGQFRLDVSQPDVPPVSLLDLMSLMVELPPISAVLGLAEDGRPVLLDFSEQDMTHILVSGMVGAGKTALLRSLVMSLALMNRQSRVQFVILDGTDQSASGGTTLQMLNYLPHMLANVIRDPNDVRETMAFLMSEVTYRLDYEVKAPTILVMIDEVVTLFELGETLVRDGIRFLAQRGADVGVHLIMSTEKPQSTVLDNLLKANVSVQIVGRLVDNEQATAITGLHNSQAEHLLGQGDFLAVSGPYMTHFQAAYIGDYDLHMTLQELHRKRAPVLLAQTVADIQQISLSSLIMEDCESERPQNFVFNGDTVSLGYEEIKEASLMVELEEITIEESMRDRFYEIPQPVIHLFHDADAAVEKVVGAEDEDEMEDWETANDSPDLEEVTAETSKIYQGLGQAHRSLIYELQSKKAAPKPRSVESLLSVPPNLALFAERESQENDHTVEDESIVDEEDNGELFLDEVNKEEGAKYEAFEDDWLPFDDD